MRGGVRMNWRKIFDGTVLRKYIYRNILMGWENEHRGSNRTTRRFKGILL